jgi:hypothetical protein
VHTRHRILSLLAAGLLALPVLAACGPIDVSAHPGSDPSATGGAAGDGVVTADLAALQVGAWAAMTGYSRDRFEHWISQGHDCDTRDVVLQRDGTGVTVGDSCKITSGTWVSPYDGTTVTDPSRLDIDHLVPLADAWRTGAATWTDDQRKAFANDLTRPQLVAVTASSNRSKGDQDPSQWKPANQAYWCTYAQSWIEVKSYYHLWVTADEKTALGQMLATC